MLASRALFSALSRELDRPALRPGSGKQLGEPRTKVLTNADIAASTTTGTEVALPGYAVRLNPTSHGSAALEVAFDHVTGDAERWVPLTTSCGARKPDGSRFSRFYVRRLATTPSNTDRVALDVDPDELGSVEFHPRTPNVDPSGAVDALMKGIRQSDGAIGTLEGADGTTATRFVPGIAVKVGAGFLPALGSTAGRVQTAPVAGQEGVAAGAGAVDALTQRTTLASNDPAVTALQIMDDWDEADRAKANIIVGQAGVAAGDGEVGATVQRAVRAQRRTYAVTIAALVGTAAEFLEILGSASQTVRVLEVAIQPSAACKVICQKNSAAHTGGTATTLTPTALDSANAAATGSVKTYTVAPTGGGTLVAELFRATLGADQLLVYRPGDEADGQRLTLRGVAQGLTVESDTAVTWRGHVVVSEEA